MLKFQTKSWVSKEVGTGYGEWKMITEKKIVSPKKVGDEKEGTKTKYDRDKLQYESNLRNVLKSVKIQIIALEFQKI